MQIELSQKERMLLEDDKHQEEVCVIKYQNYAEQAKDPELKQLFQTHAKEEQHHFDMINQMLQGQTPSMGENQTTQTSQTSQQTQTSQSSAQGISNTSDKILCSDLLSTEKFVSGLYDTGIFESANPTVRQALQHIQKEEQHHGEQIFNYMHSHGMYSVK
jgi:Coat F domain.